MRQSDKSIKFEVMMSPHLDAAYNLARWLTSNTHDAEDVVQEAFLRAYRSFDGYRGGDSRAWLLRIVRNTCCTWLRKNRESEAFLPLDDEIIETASSADTPEEQMLSKVNVHLLQASIDCLPAEFKEVLVLRDLEDLSYKDIASVLDIPIGTVMSRLARARKRVIASLSAGEEQNNEM